MRVSKQLALSAPRLLLEMGRGAAQGRSWQWTPDLGPSEAASHLKNRGYFLADVCEGELQSMCQDPLMVLKIKKTLKRQNHLRAFTWVNWYLFERNAEPERLI